MDSSSAAAEMVTLCAASGFVVHFFPTGQGNVIGNPILPVIKICANPRTVRTMSEHVDVDTSGLLQREITMSDAGDKLLDMMFRTANGRLHGGGGARPPRVRDDAVCTRAPRNLERIRVAQAANAVRRRRLTPSRELVLRYRRSAMFARPPL